MDISQEQQQAILRALPAIHSLLSHPAAQAQQGGHGSEGLAWALREIMGSLRTAIRQGQVAAVPSAESLIAAAEQMLQRHRQGRRAINATGILLHTGLGRAPLSRASQEAIVAACGYTPVQADLEEGERIARESRVEALLRSISGCQAATVVNNNAAATMLMLQVIAGDREVIISRGQLVEIGGAFRMPDVMALSGCRMREIGTTNRTHLRDYAGAINQDTGAIIHVHTSNYRVRGFAGCPAVDELVHLGQQYHIPVLDDLGSGALFPLSSFSLSDEPLVGASIQAGVDCCCFSADKLICGPQAGIICGSQEWIQRIRAHPLSRMLRVCKLTLAGLEASLLHFVDGSWRQELPLYALLGRSEQALQEQAQRLAQALTQLGMQTSVEPGQAYIGSGCLPDEAIASWVVAVQHQDYATHVLARRLRMGIPAIFTRLAQQRLLFDMRSVEESAVPSIIQACSRILQDG